jgi:hypothetical protein
MRSSAHDSSSFLGSRRSHRASERRRVPFAYSCRTLGSIVARVTRAASPPPRPAERPEHVPGGGAAVVLSAAQYATVPVAAAAVPVAAAATAVASPTIASASASVTAPALSPAALAPTRPS